MPTRFYIPVILGSSRRGRQSPRAARFIETHLRRLPQIDTEIIDLAEYDLPMLEERIRVRDDAPPRALEFAARLSRADALVVISPEYNGGYPAVLKNALDYVLPELRRKPVAIVTVSGGNFGGIEALQQLRLVLLKMGALPLPASFPVTRVQESMDEEGRPADPAWDKRATAFLGELLWLTEAIAAQREKTEAQAPAVLRAIVRAVEPRGEVEEVLEVPPVTFDPAAGFETAVFPFTTDVPFLTPWGRTLLIGQILRSSNPHILKFCLTSPASGAPARSCWCSDRSSPPPARRPG